MLRLGRETELQLALTETVYFRVMEANLVTHADSVLLVETLRAMLSQEPKTTHALSGPPEQRARELLGEELLKDFGVK